MKDPNRGLSETVIHNLNELTALRQGRPGPKEIEAHVKAIQKILGESEAFATLRKVRWPMGVVCPRCQSRNVERRDAPRADMDGEFRQHYLCLECDKGGLSNPWFTDTTGLSMDVLHSITQWATAWYVLSICSPTKAAQLLGLSLEYLLQIAVLSGEMELLPLQDELELTQTMSFRRKEKAQKDKKVKQDKEEEVIRSERSIFYTPRPKSRS